MSRDPQRATSKPIPRAARVPAVPVTATFDAKAEPKVAVIEISELLMKEPPSSLQIDCSDDDFLFEISDN